MAKTDLECGNGTCEVMKQDKSEDLTSLLKYS